MLKLKVKVYTSYVRSELFGMWQRDLADENGT